MPDWKRYLRDHLRLPAMKKQRDERALQEIADHLQDLYRDARLRGASEEEAREEALASLGDPVLAAQELMKAEPHAVGARVGRWFDRREEDLRGNGGRWTWLADRAGDLRLGLRALVRRPLFSGLVILVLALSIGATSAIFSLVDAIVLSQLPFDQPERLMAIHHTAPEQGLEDAGQCAAWHFTYEDESRAFEALGMASFDSASVTGTGGPEAVSVLEVTNGALRALRVAPAAGRIFAPADDDPDAPATVMLGHGYWQRRFGGDTRVIGRTLRVDGESREIIGVAPLELQSLWGEPALIMPLRFRRANLFVGNIGYGAVGRLREGVSREEAVADLNRLLPLAWEKFPGGPVASSDDPGSWVAQVLPLQEEVVGSVDDLLWILLGGVGLVLLISCANVASLYLVRAEGKDGEMAVRSAMGASAGCLGWEYLKESLLLGLLGGAAGLLLADLGLKALLAAVPANLPRVAEVGLDAGVVLFTLGLSLGSGLFFGFVPSFRHARGNLTERLKEGGRNRFRSRATHRTQNVLVVGQMALAVVLLVASGLTLRSVWHLHTIDPGVGQPQDVLALRLYLPRREVPEPAQVASTYESVVRRIQEIPGVTSVGLTTAVPMDGSLNVNPFLVRDQVAAGEVSRLSRRHKWIAEGYLETLRIPLLAGRTITWDDVHHRAPVALLSESLAREVFGSPEAALGRYVAARPDPPVWKEVVGVVADVREDGLDRDPPPLVYWPQVTLGFWEGNAADQVQTWRGAGIAVRSPRIGTAGFREELEAAIWEVSPNLPLQQVRPLPELMAASTAWTSFTMVLLSIAGGGALLLGLVGVYGVLSYAVSRRSRELGMRMVLGARRFQVIALVVRQGAALAITAVVLGLALAIAVVRGMSAVLSGVSPMDPVTFAIVGGAVVAVALAASYVPARRAARVDPLVALRRR